jgi:hypothetical protein
LGCHLGELSLAYGAGQMVRNQHIRGRQLAEQPGFTQSSHCHAHGTCAQLTRAERRAPMRLHVRPKTDMKAAGSGRHPGDVAVEHVKIEDDGRGVELIAATASRRAHCNWVVGETHE